jgi:hypothetical protein
MMKVVDRNNYFSTIFQLIYESDNCQVATLMAEAATKSSAEKISTAERRLNIDRGNSWHAVSSVMRTRFA